MMIRLCDCVFINVHNLLFGGRGHGMGVVYMDMGLSDADLLF